tara:strand:- start:57071 stop:58324 length:1254 start_codon:yes stop_codon:yes gene_type:complete
MALPADGYIDSALRTTGEFKIGLTDIVTDAARGNPEFTSTRTFEKGAKVKASNDIVFTSMIDGNIGNTPQADDGSNWYASVFDNVLGSWADKTGLVSAGSGLYHDGVLWRVESDIADVTLSRPSDNNASYSKSTGGAAFDFVVSQYAGGDKTKVAFISPALPLATYEWFVDTNTLQVFAKNGATGTFSDPLDFDPATGIDSGVTGVLKPVYDYSSPKDWSVSVVMSDVNKTLNSIENTYGRIVLTGTLTADRDLIVSSLEKNLIVVNNTTGGFQVKVKTLAGTGVNVPNGEGYTLRCDGVNILTLGENNKIQVLPYGAYTVDTYDYPSPLTQTSFSRLEFYGTDSAGSDESGPSTVTRARIETYPTSWAAVVWSSTDTLTRFAAFAYSSTTAFQVSTVSGSARGTGVIGFLNDGVTY